VHFFKTKFSRQNSMERELGRFFPLDVEQFKIHPPFLKATFSRWAGSKVPDNLTWTCRLLQRKVVGQLEGAEEETGNWGYNNGVGGREGEWTSLFIKSDEFVGMLLLLWTRHGRLPLERVGHASVSDAVKTSYNFSCIQPPTPTQRAYAKLVIILSTYIPPLQWMTKIFKTSS
jgi:hypothetical protein